jgi:hypothetical protein
MQAIRLDFHVRQRAACSPYFANVIALSLCHEDPKIALRIAVTYLSNDAIP